MSDSASQRSRPGPWFHAGKPLGYNDSHKVHYGISGYMAVFQGVLRRNRREIAALATRAAPEAPRPQAVIGLGRLGSGSDLARGRGTWRAVWTQSGRHRSVAGALSWP